MRFVFYVLIFAVTAVAIFFLHIPTLKFLTSPGSGSDLHGYVQLNEGMQGDSYRIEKILYGHALDISYDPVNEQYLLVVEKVEQDPDNYSYRHLITLNRDGAHQDTSGISQNELETFLSNPNLEPVPMDVERRYVPEFSFGESAGSIDLVHYQFQEFTNWPELFYGIPVVYSDWLGTAYLKITHESEVFRVQVPTDYYGGFIYTGGNVDGQIYMAARPGETSGLAFLEVSESSYTRDMDGNETHRGGYGLYVIRRK